MSNNPFAYDPRTKTPEQIEKEHLDAQKKSDENLDALKKFHDAREAEHQKMVEEAEKAAAEKDKPEEKK